MTMTPRALGQELLESSIEKAKRRGPLLRRYTVARLDETGREKLTEHMAPATPEFENAFNAFPRGTLITTDTGRCAIEDLRPGMKVETGEHGAQEVVWIGSMMMVPHAPVADPDQVRMIRVSPDRFGLSRPAGDLMVGPGARLLHFPDAMRDDDVRGQVYTPFTEFTDGDTVFEVTPPSSVEVFHLCLAQHATIYANGLPVESFHPGYHMADGMGPNRLALFLSMFPHITALRDFGLLAHPRMTLHALMRLDAA